MSDKDLLARLRAKAAQQESAPPPETESGGESSLLSRLKAKSIQPEGPVEGVVHEVPVEDTPQPIVPEETFTPDPSIQYVGNIQAQPVQQVNPLVEEKMPTIPATPVDKRKVPLTNIPLVSKAPTPEEAAKKRIDATVVLSDAFLDNKQKLSKEFHNVESTSFLDEGNQLNQLTNPHGSPDYTGRTVQEIIGSLQKDLQEANTVGDFASRDAITGKIKALKESAPAIIDLQLFNKEYTQKKYTPALVATATQVAETQRLQSIKEIDNKIAATKNWKYPNGIDAVNRREELEADKEPIERNYTKSLQDIKLQTKYNEVLLGAERSALMGNPRAREDYQKLLNGGTISPETQYAYHQIGRNIIQHGLANTANDAAKKEATEHADIEGKKLIEQNKPFLAQQGRAAVANLKFRDNPWYSAIVPMSNKVTKSEARKYAIEAGLDDESLIKEIESDPELIGQQATIWQQAAKGSLDFLAPTIYERGLRSLAYINGIPAEKVDQMFYPGWQNDRGIAAKIAGNMPSDQNSFHNVTGAVGMIAETAGMLATFGPVAGELAKVFEGAGMGEKAAERTANFGIMALEGYNGAYQQSKEIVGDKPEDESLRQLYSVLSGTVQGAMFSLHPPSRLVKNAMGEVTKTGEEFLDEIKKVGIKGAMKQEFAPAYAKYIKEIGKAQGMMIAQADANHLAQNALKNLFSPKEKGIDITEGIGDETIRTAISFIVPSIFSGIGVASQQTPLNKAVVFEIGTRPQVYKDVVAQKAREGKLTTSEANNLITSIDKIHTAIRSTPTENENGAPLSPDQVKDYSFSLLQEGVVHDKIDQLNKRSELFKLPVDKAQEAPLKKTLGELEKQRTEILVRAGEPRPEIEEEIQPAEEKVAEELEVSKEKSISLPSQQEVTTSSQQKATENGNSREQSENKEGSKDDTEQGEGAGVGQSTQVQETGDNKGRGQQEEPRVLSPEEEVKTKEQVVVEPPAQPVRRQRRKFVEEAPEEELPKAEEQATPAETQEKPLEEPAVQGSVATKSPEEIQPITKKITPDASTQSTQQIEEGNKQSGKPEHARTEQAGSKESPAKTKNSDSLQRSERPKEKEVKPRKKARTPFQKRKETVLSNDPSSFREAVLQLIMSGERVSHEDLVNDLGYSPGDMKAYLRRVSKNGTKVDGFIEQFLKTEDKQQGGLPHLVDDAIEARREFMDIWQDYGHDEHKALEELERITGVQHGEEGPAEADIAHGEYKPRISLEEQVALIENAHEEAELDKLQAHVEEVQISDEDAKKIIEWGESLLDENGEMDLTKVDPFSDDFQNVVKSLSSKEADDILHVISFTDPKKASEALDKLIKKYGKEQTTTEPIQGEHEGIAATQPTSESEGPHNGAGDRDGGKEVSPEERKEDKGRAVKSFETSEGSKYEVLPDGRTQRFKTATGEQEAPQDHTVFIKFKDGEQKQRFLRGIQDKDGAHKVSLIEKGEEKKVVLVDSKTGNVIEEAETTTIPTEGYNVFDQRRFAEGGKEFRESHIGNEVTKINYSEPAPPKQNPLTPDEKIKLERKFHQALVEKLDAAEKERKSALKSGDAKTIQETTDKVNELAKAIEAKDTKIEKLINAQVNESVFSKAADWIEKTYEKNKKSHEGETYSTIFGLSPKIADDATDFLVAKIVEGLHDLGNREMAIRRAYRLMKEKYGYSDKDLDEKSDLKNLKESEFISHPIPKKEPVLPIAQEEYAKDILADILAGKITHEAAAKEVIDEVVENAAGKPVSDAVAENAKAKVLNYIDWHIQNDITSIKNTTTRLRRIQFGLNEEVPTAKKEFGETWDEALDKIESNPQKPLELIEELSKKARPLTDVENAIILHHQNTKEIEFQKLNENINKAAEEGDEAAIVEYKTTKARVLDELQQIYDVNKAVGTENARGLASRRMMVNRKYSLVNMISEKRATANEGKALSEEQTAEIEKLHQKITETQSAFDEYVKGAESQIIDLQRKALKGKSKDKNTVSAKLREWADKIDAANKNTAYSSPVPITPKMIADGMRLIADGIDKGEEIIHLVKKAVGHLSSTTPGIDEQQLEKELNKAIIDSGVIEVSSARSKATNAFNLFTDGKLDREATRLKVEADRAKGQYDVQLKRDKEQQLSGLAKGQNLFIKWQRAFKLSNPLTLGKLFNAGFTRLITTPLEDIVGGAYSKLLPQLAKGAIGEGGGLNINETARAYKNGLMLGMRDAKKIMSKGSDGKSDLDVLFGKAGELPPEAIDFFGQLHSAIKAPFKRTMFERSLERRLRRNLAAGVDITDPMVQTSIMMDAYKDGNRAIFMQDNRVAEGWQKMIRHFDQVDPKTGKAPSKAIGTTLQWLVPFVRIPTNIAAEIGTHVYGVPVGAAKILHAAFTKGIENIPDDQKEIILRNLKKGSLGVAAVALGYFNPQNFGGYYQPGQKRDEDDAEAMGLKLFDEKIPAWFIEAPIWQAMQLGATVRRVKDKMVKGEDQGIAEGVWAGASGLLQTVPMASQPVRVAHLFGSKRDRDYYLGELAKSTVDPSLITYLAKVTDPADEGSVMRKILAPENKRKAPKTIWEHIKSGLPFLREELPEK